LQRTLPYNPFQWSIGADALLNGWNLDYLVRFDAAASAKPRRQSVPTQWALPDQAEIE